MKLPKLPAQWERLDSYAKARIDEVADEAAMFLVLAGYTSPQDHDENGDEIGNDVQSLLMDAMLRAPFLYLHITKLNALTLGQGGDPEEEGHASVADIEAAMLAGEQATYRTWARDAAIPELRDQRNIMESRTLDVDGNPDVRWKLQIINIELYGRAGAADAAQDWHAKAMDLPDHQREYADRIWDARYGKFAKPRNPEEWERFYRIGNEMDGTVGRDKDGK